VWLLKGTEDLINHLNVRMPTMDDSLSTHIQYCKKQLVVLLRPIVALHCVDFQRTAICARIRYLNQPLDKREQAILGKAVKIHFETFIHVLIKLCPAITPTEILICCLSFCFPTKTIALCLGYTYTNPIRQHKLRIRKKMRTVFDNMFMFNFIFGN